jgi:hypothetical protein
MGIEINVEFFFKLHYFSIPTQTGKKEGRGGGRDLLNMASIRVYFKRF